MVLSASFNEKLLKERWVIRRVRNVTYYIKSIFETEEYFMLITDLREAWFEHGDFKRIQQNALLPRIDIETKSEASALLVRVKQLFLDNWNKCDIKQVKEEMQIICDKSQHNAKVNTLCWIFHCSQLSRQEGISSAQVIFDHFIQPSQAIINYFTDNLSDDACVQIKLPNAASSMFSTTSLSFISDVINDKNSTKRKQQEDITQEVLEEEEVIEKIPLTKEELEIKHREDLMRLAEEERQRNPRAAMKKRRKL